MLTLRYSLFCTFSVYSPRFRVLHVCSPLSDLSPWWADHRPAQSSSHPWLVSSWRSTPFDTCSVITVENDLDGRSLVLSWSRQDILMLLYIAISFNLIHLFNKLIMSRPQTQNTSFEEWKYPSIVVSASAPAVGIYGCLKASSTSRDISLNWKNTQTTRVRMFCF